MFSAASRTHRIETSIDIHASPERVWSVLTDFARYPRWNPFVRTIEGELEAGRTLDVSIQPPGGRAMRFHPVVLAVEPGHELRWKGKLLIPGLFDGEHWFRIRPAPHGRVVFEHGEQFTGMLVPRFKPSLDQATRAGFVAMNEALKAEAERV
ncbi:MAG: SRPBCC domain-containing protein [Betaproteobacteria bacterium]